MKYFFDTEFIEWEGGIQLISLGIVKDDGSEFYAENMGINPRIASDWVKENVFPKLKYWSPDKENIRGWGRPFNHVNGKVDMNLFGTEIEIARKVIEWIGEDMEPRFFAYFASYDWVVFARLFGRLIDKPPHFPMWVVDLKQMMWERGLTKEWKQEVHPDPTDEHNALADAIWNKGLYELLMKEDQKYTRLRNPDPDALPVVNEQSHC